MFEDSMVRLMDKVSSRYFGKYTGFVKDNSDPENRGRLRAQVPAVYGPTVISGWALPCAPFGGMPGQGMFFIPDVNAGVWIEFQGGDPDYPIWVGTFWSKPGGTTEVPPPANNQAPPTSKIIATPNHTIEFADKNGAEAITITDSANKNVVILDKNGISIQDQNHNQITLTSSGIDIKDANGNEIALDPSGTTINSPEIKLGKAASEPMVLGNMLNSLLTPFFTLIATHVHPTAAPGAPTGPSPAFASPPPALANALSKKHMVE